MVVMVQIVMQLQLPEILELILELAEEGEVHLASMAQMVLMVVMGQVVRLL
jgi:hypothetical protein